LLKPLIIILLFRIQDVPKLEMRIAFVHPEYVFDKNLWSGTTFFIYQNLTKKFDDVLLISPIKEKGITLKYILGSLSKVFSKLTGKQCLNLYYSYFLPKKQGKFIDNYLKKYNVDCVISTTNTPFLFTKNNIPLVIITDATVKLLYNEYSKGAGWSKLFYKALEENALKVTNKASLIVSSSTITTRSLIKDYNVYPEKIATIPFGANIDYPDIQVPQRIVNKEKQVNFLFIGKDWKRKGGDFAVLVCDELSKRGFNINLTIVGCKVPENGQRSYIKNYIYLDKNKQDDYSLLESLLKNSHFLMVFSEAEMYGLVFCEAAAYGLPSVAFAVGGIADIVINNKTGIILPKDSTAEDFVLMISELIYNRDKYQEISNNARKRYEELLNWDVFTTSLKNEIYKRVK
jgi:glycosyltransferase involved in cell wall biosynthesis